LQYDYTHGTLGELIDIVIEYGATLFVSAVGVPEPWVIEKLHKANILVMNMVGHPKHVHKACAAGVDIICAQGGEAGGHTGDIPSMVLLPACADICSKYTSPLTKKPVTLVAAGGINDGRSVAAALMLGAEGCWVGTRFIPSVESKAPEVFKKQVIAAGYDDWVKLTVWSGRPLRALRNPYLTDWEQNRAAEIKDLTSRGIVPLVHELDKLHESGKLTDEIEEGAAMRPAGIVAGSVNKPGQTAAEIVTDMVEGAQKSLAQARSVLQAQSSRL
jgi:NAD(P)H-dependent flavin oxidoreductase YrpB (nitropropane dioxygenase family)